MQNNTAQLEMVQEVAEHSKFRLMILYGLSLIVFGFIIDTPSVILNGIIDILKAPGLLITDYMVVGGIGAAFVNAGLVYMMGLTLVYYNKVKISGPIIAALFTLAGFALFGKNILNILPIFLGVYIYSKIKGEPMGKFILAALFGTALGPMISQISLGFGFNIYVGLTLSILIGVLAGIVVQPLASHLLRTHQGYNIYNIGFTAGIIGTMAMSIFKTYGLSNNPPKIWGTGFNGLFIPVLSIYFVSMIIVGIYFSKGNLDGLKEIYKLPGTLVSDFASITGFGSAFMNMGIVGLAGMVYIIAVKGDLNGPTIGGLLTIVGFGAFGKHARNIIPVMLGVYLATLTNVYNANDYGPLLAALFGTTLAPISGTYGPLAGVLAGFIHLSVVSSVGVLHGGMNLYNNGFSGGLVAAFLVPIVQTFLPEKNN